MYSVLRVDESGHVPLLERHARRLGVGAGVLRDALRAPGVFRVTWNGAELVTEQRPGSRLVDDMPARFVVSPYAQRVGRFAKPAPPSAYDGVRVNGVSTLLTSGDGRELYESCSASLVAWDGSSIVVVPLEAPGVASVAEDAVVDALPHRRGVIEVGGDWPLLLINAVASTCAIAVGGRAAFPSEVRRQIHDMLQR